jgi:putative DNA primase/helicase
MTDHIAKFVDDMISHGVGPSDPGQIRDDDTINRYHVDGDKPRTENGVYRLACDGDFAYGWFMSHRDGELHKWHTRAARGGDRDAHAARVADAKRKRDADTRRVHQEAAERAADLWSRASRDGTTPYLDRKRIGLCGARVSGDMVVVPMYKDAAMVGLQYIGADGTKRFLTGADKSGSYHSMRGPDMGTIRICEGFATAAAIRDTYPSNPVIVAWDAGNIAAVARAMRERYPDAAIVICADNDQWTTRPKTGEPWNPGLEYARQAAVAIGGCPVMWPDFPDDDPDRRTDWWDYWDAHGSEAMRAAMDVPAVRQVDAAPPMDIEVVETDRLVNIRPLGHNKGTYYFFPRNAGQIIKKSAGDLARIERLFDLAPLEFWEMTYGDGKMAHPDIAKAAANHLIAICHEIGVFQPSSTRGVGVWRDDCGVILNTGARIIGDGIDKPPSEFKGRYVYESGPRLVSMSGKTATESDASALLDICCALHWKRPVYGHLLAGWNVVAPMGGVLKWKPHIWLTGESGAGKSTVMDEIVKKLHGDYAVLLDGGSTEPGVRMALGVSSRPFIMDEAESESQSDRMQMERIIGLFRKASSGGIVGNATGDFQAMSCACFAAINPSIKETADKARITLLELAKDTRPDANIRYLSLMDRIHNTITGDYHRRMFIRTFTHIETLLQNIAAFNSAASDMFKNKRQADQLAPMIAGAHFLTSLNKISVTQAREWLDVQDWQWYTAIADETDAVKLVSHIMSSRVSYDTNGVRREGAIGDLVETVYYGREGSADISRGLRTYGIKVERDRLLIANSSKNLSDVLRNTPWNPWQRTLGDYPGSDNFGNKSVYFMAGLIQKVTAIPIAGLISETVDYGEDIGF